MKQWKERARRLQAGVLAFAMCLSLAVTGVWAEGSGNKTGTVANGAFVADQTNKTLGETFTEGASNTVTGGDKIEITKTAKAVPCQNGNQFEVTLQVVTHDQEIKTVESPDAAVTLVIDVSGSMDYCSECGNENKNCVHYRLPLGHRFNDQGHGWSSEGAGDGKCDVDVGGLFYYKACGKTEAEHKSTGKTRLEAAQASAKDFLDSLKSKTPQNADGTYPARYVSVVSFSSSASQKCEWKNIMTKEGYDAVLAAVNGLSANGGTRPDQGLDVANTLMQEQTVNKVDKANKFTVLLTDGKPDANYFQTSTLCNYAKASAAALKENSNAIYSVYYGDATDKCYSDVTVENFLKSFSNNVYSAATAGGLTDTFENISQTITMLTKAWEVTDPMGANVKFEGVTTSQGEAVASEANGVLTWDLKADTAKVDGTTRTYTLKYLVTVDATGEDWKEGEIHPLNRYTALSYVIENADGGYTDVNGNPVTGENPPTIGFNVPGVIVERPGVSYIINYLYKDKATGEYVNDKTTTTDAKLWDKINVQSSAYSKTNYFYVRGDEGQQTLSKDGLVFNLYYDPIETGATVNHYYKVITTKADGTVETRDWPAKPDLVVSKPGENEKPLYVGDPFTADEVTTWDSKTGFKLDKKSDNKTINSLDETKAENVINLYYTLEIDEREESKIEVEHVYRTHTWTLKDGKYELVDTKTDPIAAGDYTGKVGLSQTISTEPTTGYEDYEFNAGDSDLTNPVPFPKNGTTTVTLYFDKTIDERGEPIEITVKHHYRKSVTSIAADGTVRTDITTGEVIDDPVSIYVGEKFVAEEKSVYNDEDYTPDANNRTVYNHLPVSMTVHLYYDRVEEPDTTRVTVTHIYQSITKETVTKYEPYRIDEDTVIQIPVGTEVVDGDPVTDKTVEEGPVEVYVGQKYTATLRGETGYEYLSSTPNGYTIEACVKDGNEIEIIYQKSVNTDNRDEATIDVQHRYTTHVTAIVGGEEKTFDIVNSEFDQATTGKAGDKFKAEIKLTDEAGKEYELVGDKPAEVVLHAGTNSTIVIDYERSDNQLGDKVNYTVNYQYYTRTMVIENGVAVWGETVLDTETSEDPAGDGYVGQKVTLDTGAKDGYTAYGNNPSATQFLAESGNEWTFQYVKDVPLEKVPVTVNHHITTKTLTIDGESSFTQDLMGRPEYKYKGEAYEANALPVDGLMKVTVNKTEVEMKNTVKDSADGNVVIDFYYEIVIDYRVSAFYTVQHIYKTINWDGTEITDNPDSVPDKYSSHVGKAENASIILPENAGYELNEATHNGTDVMGQMNDGTYAFTVRGGSTEGINDVVVFTYVRYNRPVTSVKVVHEYYHDLSALEAGENEGTYSEIKQDKISGDSYTADERTEHNNLPYENVGVAQQTITLQPEDGAEPVKNVIVFKYVRAETTYTVVHEYYTDGTLTGSTPSVVTTGKVGDVITADGIAKVTTYGGNTYTYTSAAGAPLTLVQGENGTITLRYERTTGGGGGGGTTEDTYRLTIHYVYADGTPARDDYVRSGLRAGASYSRTSPTISGYTADITLVEGTMPARNVEVTVTYSPETPEPTETPNPTETPEPTPTPGPVEDLGDNDVPMNQLPGDVVDLWDEDVALSDLPEELEELSDEDVPLAQAPATGDSLLTWLSGALASGTGLLWLGGRKKREDEDEEI